MEPQSYDDLVRGARAETVTRVTVTSEEATALVRMEDPERRQRAEPRPPGKARVGDSGLRQRAPPGTLGRDD